MAVNADTTMKNLLLTIAQALDGDNVESQGVPVSLATGLNQTDDKVTAYPVRPTAVNLTAAVAALTGAGQILGFYVNSTSAGSLVIKDGTTTGGTAISGTITPAVGYHPFPASVTTGAFFDVSGTINITAFVVPA